jgi:hypothetical protein
MRTQYYPNCHAINPGDKTNLEYAVGFGTGDILYKQLNNPDLKTIFNKVTAHSVDHALIFLQNGHQIPGSVNYLTWIPNTVNHFVACFSSGWLVVYNTQKEEKPQPNSFNWGWFSRNSHSTNVVEHERYSTNIIRINNWDFRKTVFL